MAKPKLSPAERARIAARYVETSNASQVARECGVSEGTVRNVIAQQGVANRYELHARAVDKAVRKARRSLARRIDSVDMYLLHAADVDNEKVPGVIGLEPRDFAAVLNAQCNITARLHESQERAERSRQARLTRDKTRAETALLKARTEAISGLSSALQGATDEELAMVATILERARRRGGPTSSNQERASAADESDGSDPSAS